MNLPKIDSKSQSRIINTANAITNDPSNAYVKMSEFLEHYISPDTEVYRKLLHEVVLSIGITWKSFNKSNSQQAKAQFNQYLQRILAGCWEAIDNLPK